MAKTKAEIIKAYQDLKIKLGRRPSIIEFQEQTGILRRPLTKHFGRGAFNALAKACGEEPRQFKKDRTDLDEILTKYGYLARKLKVIPTGPDWTYHNMKPTKSGITTVHKIKWLDLQVLFYNYAKDNPEWADIIHLFDQTEKSNNKTTKQNTVTANTKNTYRNEYVPPVVENLINLSFDEEKAIEFENKVNVAFEILGFEVKKYGQGTGRNPDGIALSRENHYAILIDAKSRGEGYKLGTEDRKFIEYIKTHTPLLKKEGIHKIYFLVVSSSFESVSKSSLDKVLSETQVPVSLIMAEQILKILAFKIENPRQFDLQKFKNILINGGLVTDTDVQRFLDNKKTSKL